MCKSRFAEHYPSMQLHPQLHRFAVCSGFRIEVYLRHTPCTLNYCFPIVRHFYRISSIMKIKKQEPHIKMCGSCLCRLLFFLFVGLTNLACGRVYPRYFIRILALPLSLSLAILFSRICLTRSRVSPSWSPISSSPFS